MGVDESGPRFLDKPNHGNLSEDCGARIVATSNERLLVGVVPSAHSGLHDAVETVRNLPVPHGMDIAFYFPQW